MIRRKWDNASEYTFRGEFRAVSRASSKKALFANLRTSEGTPMVCRFGLTSASQENTKS